MQHSLFGFFPGRHRFRRQDGNVLPILYAVFLFHLVLTGLVIQESEQPHLIPVLQRFKWVEQILC